MPIAADSSKTAVPTAPATEASNGSPIVIDLGRRRRKKVKQLREGRGSLMDDVGGVLEELRAAGAIGASAQPVVIVVREKRKNQMAWPLG